MSVALKTYHRLGPSSRSLVASLRGYYLNWWRYDKHTEKRVAEALERDFWSKEDWADWQSRRLRFVLERAATTVPYYRDIWAGRRRNGDKRPWDELENWPILEKKELRNHSRRFVADDRSRSRMFHESTSGTTGTSLDLWISGQTVKEWYALFEARCRRWYGLTRHDRWAILGGQLVVPAHQQDPPFWVWNSGMNQLYLSSYHLSPRFISAYLDALIKYRIKYIFGYSSAIYALAVEASKQNLTGLSLSAAITNAEPLYEYQRTAISSAFKCPVRETYGMAEMVGAGSECAHGTLHQWPEAGIIESLNNNSSDSQDFVCTGLINVDMPLIRYRVGDSGSLSNEKCKCGRTLPSIQKIDGRTDDVLYTADGRCIGRMDPIFKSSLPLIEAQIIQESLTKVTVRYVPDIDFDSTTLPVLANRIRERMGQVEVSFGEMSQIPRTSRGKFRAVICNLSEDERVGLKSSTSNHDRAVHG